MNRWKLLPVFLLLVVLLSLLAAPVSAASDSDLCYQYTPKMTADAFRYLDEMYIQKYPQMGLRWTQGTEKDKQVLQRLADIITEGCTTDEQKAEAVAGWIQRNIEYYENSGAFYAIDVFYSRTGNCASYAQLMSTLLRLEGIKAVYSDGFRMDTQATTVGQMRTLNVGHAWCFAYVGGQWKLYDPLWEGSRGLTDRDYISKNYLIETVDVITPVYDTDQIPPVSNPNMVQAYINGRFMYYRNGQPISSIGNHNHGINGSGFYCFSICNTYYGDPNQNQTLIYPDDPDRMKDMLPGEIYHNGWISSRDGIMSMNYAYENGVQAHGIVMERDGVRYFMHQSHSYRLLLEEGQYTIRNGYMSVEPGFSGKIMEPTWCRKYKDDPEYRITWRVEEGSSATVDENGVITCMQEEEMTSIIWAELRRVEQDGSLTLMATEVLMIGFWEEDRVADYTDHIPHVCSYQVQVVPPTCNEGGYTLHVCSCGNSYRDQETMPLDHSFGQWQTVREATEQQEGLQMRQCTRCGKEETQNVAYAPPEHVCDYKVVQVVEPSCETGGYTVSKCSCGRVQYSDERPPLGGHRYGAWETLTPPTEENDGLRGRECNQCGYFEVEQIPAGTDISPDPTDPNGGEHICHWVAVEVVEPRCDEGGFTVYGCAECGIEKLDDFTPAGHHYGPWEVLQEPDEWNTGLRVRVCEYCGDFIEEEIPAENAGQVPTAPTQPPQPTDPVSPPATEPSRPTEPSVPAPTDPAPTDPVSPEGIWIRGEGESQVSVLFPGADPAQLEGISVLAQVVEDTQQMRDHLERHVGPVAQMYLMDISLMAGGQSIQPDGIVVVEMPIPDSSWLEGQIAVYHINENGGVTSLQTDLSEDGTKVLFVVEHFSYYALAQHAEDQSPVEPTEPTEPTEPKAPQVPDAPEPERFPWLPVGIVVAVIIAAGVAVLLVRRKKGK